MGIVRVLLIAALLSCASGIIPQLYRGLGGSSTTGVERVNGSSRSPAGSDSRSDEMMRWLGEGVRSGFEAEKEVGGE